MEKTLDFVLEFYRDAEFGCLEYCDKSDKYSVDRYWKYFERRDAFREMLFKLGFTWDEINDLDTRLAAEFARKNV